MKKVGLLIVLLVLFAGSYAQSKGKAVLISSAQPFNIRSVFTEAESQTRLLIQNMDSLATANLVSPRTLENGELKLVASRDWTSGFFPGELWYLYEFTREKEWLDEARKWTTPIEKEKLNKGTHDMGFKVYCSVGNAYRLTKDPHYKEVIIEAAASLSTRFNEKTGVIRSWDHSREKWAYPVIIDNMMNLELLFEAAKLAKDKRYYNIAVSHANTTLKNHFRADYSSYHVVDYDTATGRVIKKTTHQGFADASAWSRGQAWALYGYTLCYRETKDKRFLEQAEHIADYLLHHPRTPEDGVPYWDYDAPGIPQEPRDASAAAVMASALLELSTYSKNKVKFYNAAVKKLTSLTEAYRAPAGAAQGFLLLHSTGAKPSGSEVDVPLIYADYYYLEALIRLSKIRGK